MRLDKYLVEKGYFESRNRAIGAIDEGLVLVNGKAAKASTKVDENTMIEIKENKFYVSRAAKKLEGFLEVHPMELEGRVALDIGSSTGGFAQILLENAVGELDCVDVGSDQLHYSLRDNPKLSLFEETDIRSFKSDKSYDVVTCDVSFISILQIIEDIDRLASNNIIILYKPQFEVGREAKRDKRGVVTDTKAIERVQEEFGGVCERLGWHLICHTSSTLSGKDGNLEYLYHFKKVVL